MTKVRQLRKLFENCQISYDQFQTTLARLDVDLTNVEGMFIRACPWTVIKSEVKHVLLTNKVATC